MESDFREVEYDLRKLEKTEKQKRDLDKRHNLNKAVSMAGESPTKGVRFKI